jgi:membrane protease YdiL (CAAX protease family)
MLKLKEFALEKPLLFSILLMILALFLEIVPAKYLYLPFMNEQLASYFGEITMRGIICILLLIMLKYFGIIKMAYFTVPAKWRHIWLIWPVIALILINALDILTGKVIINTSDNALLLTFITNSISTGFFEEILVRGSILSLLICKWGNTRKGIYLSVVCSSLIFGLAHLINLVKNPELLLATSTQIFYATFLGVLFASLLLRTRSIWLIIFSHALFNFFGSIREIAVGGGFAANELAQASTTMANMVSAIIITLPLLMYGLIILRKVTPKNVFEPLKMNSLPEEDRGCLCNKEQLREVGRTLYSIGSLED